MRFLVRQKFLAFFSFFSAATLACLSIVPNAYAACDPGQPDSNLFDCFQLNKNQTVQSVYSTPAVLINLLVRTLFIGAGLIFFFLILMAGFQLVSGGKKGGETAKTMLTTAVTGFVLMFAGYWVLQIIKYVTGTNLLF